MLATNYLFPLFLKIYTQDFTKCIPEGIAICDKEIELVTTSSMYVYR